MVLDELAHDELCVCIPPAAVPSLQSLICAKSSTGVITVVAAPKIKVARIKVKVL